MNRHSAMWRVSSLLPVSGLAALCLCGPLAPPSQAQSSGGAAATAAPANLMWTALAADRVGLAWSAAAPAGPESKYQVFRDGQNIATVEGTRYSDQSVKPATTYSYSVAAVDGAGKVLARSPAITVTSPAGSSVTIAGAGDIATGEDYDEATAALLDGVVAQDPAAIVFTLGDDAYPSKRGNAYDYHYEPSWGRHKQRTRPIPGNHDYETDGGRAHYDYFGASAGPAGKGYYSYDLADWHIVALNSNIGVEAGSEQEQWLRADLAAHARDCILAIVHEPLFSSGAFHGGNPIVRPLWQALSEYGADVMLSGNEHNYERFDPQTPYGVADPEFGMRAFVVGTGGVGHYGFAAPVGNSAARNSDDFGILRFTLKPGGYDWAFLSTSGRIADEGSGTCSRGLPPRGMIISSIASGTDDALEGVADKASNVTSSGVYLGHYRDGSEQLAGLRFSGLDIPSGSRIKNAFIQFAARDSAGDAIVLTFRGEAAGDSKAFAAEAANLSARPTTSAAVVWTPDPWKSGEASQRQRTPSLAAIVQEIIDQPGWQAGNALAFIVSGSGPGSRVASSFDRGSGSVPQLIVEFAPAN